MLHSTALLQMSRINFDVIKSNSYCLVLPHAYIYLFSNLSSLYFIFLHNNLQVEKIEDSIEFISSRPKPLALYVFTKNQTLQSRMISETSSGSVTFNDAILQVLLYTLQFFICQFLLMFKYIIT